MRFKQVLVWGTALFAIALTVSIVLLMVCWPYRVPGKVMTVHLKLREDSFSRILNIAMSKGRKLQSIEGTLGDESDDEESPFDTGITANASEVLAVKEAVRQNSRVRVETSTWIPALEVDAIEDSENTSEVTVAGPVPASLVNKLGDFAKRRLGVSSEADGAEAMHFEVNCDFFDDSENCSVELFNIAQPEDDGIKAPPRQLCGRRRRRRRRRRAPPPKQLVEERFTASWTNQAAWAKKAATTRTEEFGRLCFAEVVRGRANRIRGADPWNGWRADGGHYGTRRQPGPFSGIDLICKSGEVVQVPFSATVVSQTSNSILLHGSEEWSALYLKLSNIISLATIGKTIYPGEALGHSISMQSEFPGIIDHVHLQLFLDSADKQSTTNPTDYMCNTSFKSGAAEWNQVPFVLLPVVSTCPNNGTEEIDVWMDEVDMNADPAQTCLSRCTNESSPVSSIAINAAGRCACSSQVCSAGLTSQIQAFQVLGQTGFQVLGIPGSRCKGFVSLPHWLNHTRLHPWADPAQECAVRCTHAYGPQEGFHLFKHDHGCACSSGPCSNLATDTDYSYYRIVKRPPWAAWPPLQNGIDVVRIPTQIEAEPQELFPPRLDLFANPVQECAMRCSKPHQKETIFFLSIEQHACACVIQDSLDNSTRNGFRYGTTPSNSSLDKNDTISNPEDKLEGGPESENDTTTIIASTIASIRSPGAKANASLHQYALYKTAGLRIPPRSLSESGHDELCKDVHTESDVLESGGPDEQKCKDWYRKEPEPTWADQLPPCPEVLPVVCALSFLTGRLEFELLDERFVHDIMCKFPDCNSKYHLGAAGCLRSADPVRGKGMFEGNKHGQQCCYRRDGSLITSIPGAGTADREIGSITNARKHRVADVRPANWCCERNINPKFCCLYYLKRPANTGEGYKLPFGVKPSTCDSKWCGLNQCFALGPILCPGRHLAAGRHLADVCLSTSTTTTNLPPVDRGLLHFRSQGTPRTQIWQFPTPVGQTSVVSFNKDTMVLLGDKVTVLDGANYVAAALSSSARADGLFKGPPAACAEGLVTVKYEEGPRTVQQQGPQFMTRGMATWRTIPSTQAQKQCGPQFDNLKGVVSYANARPCSGTRSVDLHVGQSDWMTDHPAVGRYGSNMWCEWRVSVRRRYQVRVSFRHMDLEGDLPRSKCYDFVKVFDGPAANAYKEDLCGFGSGQPFTSTQGGVTVRFQSDSNGAGYGFLANAAVVTSSSGTLGDNQRGSTRSCSSRSECGRPECEECVRSGSGDYVCQKVQQSFFDGCDDVSELIVVVATTAAIYAAVCGR